MTHPIARVRHATRKRLESARAGRGDEGGFTLIELVVVVAIMPIILGGIAVALLSVVSLSGSVSSRVSDSNDAFIGSVNFNRDVQSAVMLTTSGYPACGTSGTQLLGLEWGYNTSTPASTTPTTIPGSPASGFYQTVVSYTSIQANNGPNGGATWDLVRSVCSFGPTSAPSTTTVSHDLGTAPSVTISGQATAQNTFPDITSEYASTWKSTQGVTKVAFNINEPGSRYAYALTGLPGESASQGTFTPTVLPNTNNGCNFATSGTGTYSNQLCFVDFTGYTGASTAPTSLCPTGGQYMAGPVQDTPYTVSFCVAQATNQYNPAQTTYPDAAWPIPTYYDQNFNSEAFLGNNGFYTGISGDPALYEHTCSPAAPPTSSPCNSGGQTTFSTVYITDFQVLDAAGHAATGWTLVTGDAESTDTNEWMDFTSNTSGVTWSILPNNGPSDLYGNSCYDDKDANNSGLLQYTGPTPPTSAAIGTPSNGPPAQSAALTINPSTYATGVSSVLCEADQQLNKTGTLMLSAQEPVNSSAPQSITVTMQGTGWAEAMFLGVLL